MDSARIRQYSPDWIWETDPEGHFTYSSERCNGLLGYAADELLSLSIQELAIPAGSGVFADVAHHRSSFRLLRHWVRCKDGRALEVETSGEPIIDGSGCFRGLLAISRDRSDPPGDGIRPLRSGNNHGMASDGGSEPALRQRDALVREIHHRIKNTLQGVASLLWQQALKYPDSRSAIEQAVSQVRSIATVYGLQGRFGSGVVLLCELVPVICSTAESLFPHRVDVVQHAQLSQQHLIPDEEAVPLALVINELIFNAIKHGGPPDGRTKIEVGLSDTDDSARLVVRNHGSLPDSFDFDRGEGIGTGLDLVRALLPRRGAQLSFAKDGAMVEASLLLTAPVID